MKKFFWKITSALAAATLLLGGGMRPVAAENPTYKAAYVCDAATGTVTFEKDAEKHLPIASMCKIMTLLLTFEAADRGELSYEEEVPVSENAAGMGGSQVFLAAGLSYKAEELIKTVIVCSANDSCVALAERVTGSEEGFIARMNERAKELGAENTLFSNCTGLPRDPQYSCAKDVALMLRALISHEKYFEYASIHTEDFAHPDGRTTLITNTNKLLRAYKGCDGGKTGFTNEAGFCLAATAKRDTTRLICVVIGEESSKQRFADTSRLLDETFACYSGKTLVEGGAPLEVTAAVRGGKKKEIGVVAEHDLTVFCKKGEEKSYSVEYEIDEGLKAPVCAGEKVGCARVYKEGVEVASAALLAGEDAEKIGYFDAYREAARNWN